MIRTPPALQDHTILTFNDPDTIAKKIQQTTVT